MVEATPGWPRDHVVRPKGGRAIFPGSSVAAGAGEIEGLAWGTALDWALTLALGLCLFILVGIVVSRVFFRGRQTDERALWLHLTCLCVAPLALLVVGNFAVLEYSKEVRFCGACHAVMKPYVDDMLRQSGQSLAALHYQHRMTSGSECYSCHADYGMHGNLEAKLVGLSDVYKYVTGTYRFPIKPQLTFENRLCLKCHNGAKRFMAEPIHLENGRVAAELREGRRDCIQCHGPAHELPKVPRVAGTGAPG